MNYFMTNLPNPPNDYSPLNAWEPHFPCFVDYPPLRPPSRPPCKKPKYKISKDSYISKFFYYHNRPVWFL